ncbi:MAG: leucine-rich repeat domain-containing protein [Muribaculaceae bacterium]|nr:leucine-rich repeat domain-containing protein [Muribaculaceae bacterium]
MRHIFIMAAAAWGCLGTMTAHDLESDGLYYNILPDGEAQVCNAPDGIRYIGDLIVPAVIFTEDGDFPVTGIASFTFMDCTELTGITLPESIRKIGERAFTSCISLKNITIPRGVRTIGERAFSGCTGITEVNFECESATMGEGAFENVSALTWVYITGTPTVGKGAFANCTSLEWVEIEQGIEMIGGRAFANCNSIRTVYAHSEWPPMISIDTFDSSTEATAELKVIAGAKGRYTMAAYWNRFGNISETTIFPVATDEIEILSPIVQGGKGMIFINAESGNYTVFDINGIRIGEFDAEIGRTGIAVEPGVYMVSGGTSSACTKVLVK